MHLLAFLALPVTLYKAMAPAFVITVGYVLYCTQTAPFVTTPLVLYVCLLFCTEWLCCNVSHVRLAVPLVQMMDRARSASLLLFIRAVAASATLLWVTTMMLRPGTAIFVAMYMTIVRVVSVVAILQLVSHAWLAFTSMWMTHVLHVQIIQFLAYRPASQRLVPPPSV